jgi:hypothetical protein
MIDNAKLIAFITAANSAASLTYAQRTILVTLALHADRTTGIATMTHRKIVGITNADQKTVDSTIERLRVSGWIRTQGQNEFVLNWARAA